jgi:4-hydroxy-tetrahydrodipicolinate synthase
VILFGIATEFYKLTDKEQRKLIKIAAAECAGTDTQLLVSVTQHATKLAVECADFAVSTGADGLMLLPPFFLGPSEQDITGHIKQVSEAVNVPVMVQYAPEQTGVPIPPEVFRELSAAVENIDYFKIESQPPGPYITKLLEKTNGAVDIMVGYAGIQMIESMDRGAVGVIPGCSLSDIYLDIYECHRQGRRTEAISIHNDLLPLLTYMVQDIEMFIHLEKRLLYKRGIIGDTGTNCRSPSFSADGYQDAVFEEYYKAIKPHFDRE